MKKQNIEKLIEKKKKDNEKIIKDYINASSEHKAPVNRRDFLRLGIISSMSYVMAPNLLHVISNNAYAATAGCPAPDSGSVAFITVNFAGGWGITGNWVPFDEGNQPLSNYAKFSQGANPNTFTALGNNARFFDNRGGVGGKFIESLLASAGAAANRTAFVGIPSATQNDTGDNAYDMTGLLLKAGASGSQLPNMGTRNSKTGINQLAAFGVNGSAPLVVRSINDISGALSLSGALNQFNDQQKIMLAETVSKLSDTQARSLASLSGGENLSLLVNCATEKNIENLVGGAAATVDPRNNATVTGIWNIGNVAANNADLVRASLAYNCILGNSGPVGIDMGGYDYHDQGRTTQDNKDRTAGDLIGKILATAQALNKKVFISIISDGSVSTSGTAQGDQWLGDSSDTAAAAFLAFDPAGVPATSGQQIGWFKASTRSVDRSFISAGSAQMTAATLLVNWAKFSGDVTKATKVLPRNTFTTQQLDQVIKIA